MSEKPGINFKTDEDGNLVVGIHIETFLAYFTPKKNERGWINFTAKKRTVIHDKGYTHELITKKKEQAA